MGLRDLVRGTIPWDRLEAVGQEMARRNDRECVHITFFEADNWLSTPCIVDEEYFLKIISPQNSLVHGIITTGRNIGAFSSGTEGFFDRFNSPVEMATHEVAATERMRSLGIKAPRPVESFEVAGLGVVVLEYLDDFDTFETLPAETVESYASALFKTLATLHANQLAHGDLRAENVLVHEGELTLIDATKVKPSGIDAASAYDIACALAVLEPIIGADQAVETALEVYDAEVILEALEFLDFVHFRPDHDFDSDGVRHAIERALTNSNRK